MKQLLLAVVIGFIPVFICFAVCLLAKLIAYGLCLCFHAPYSGELACLIFAVLCFILASIYEMT